MALESARVSSVGGVQGAGPLLEQLCSLAMVNGGWSHEADAGMAMLFVVPLEEALAVSAGFFQWYNEQHRHSGIGFMTPTAVQDRKSTRLNSSH